MAKRFEFLKFTLLTTVVLLIIRFPSPNFLLHNDCFHIIREHMIRRRGKDDFMDCKSANCVKPDAKCWLLETIVVASGGPYIQSHDSFKITYFRPKPIQSDMVLAMCGYFFIIKLKRHSKSDAHSITWFSWFSRRQGLVAHCFWSQWLRSNLLWETLQSLFSMVVTILSHSWACFQVSQCWWVDQLHFDSNLVIGTESSHILSCRHCFSLWWLSGSSWSRHDLNTSPNKFHPSPTITVRLFVQSWSVSNI